MKIGLVLEGGGMRGLYTAGVLDELMDSGIEFDTVIGVSAGAVFGINLLSKQKGRVLRYNKKYVGDKRYMGFGSLIKTGNIINKQFAYYDVPNELDKFDEETYEKSKSKFYAVITNVNTGKAEYPHIKNGYEQIEELRASSSMPFVSKIVEVNGNGYLDGAIADSIPIKKCMEMCDKVIVVLTRPLGYQKKKSNQLITKLKYKKYPNLVYAINNRYKMYNETLDLISKLESNKEIVVIRPSKTIKVKRLEKDINKLQELYDLGINDFNNKLEEIKNYLNR